MSIPISTLSAAAESELLPAVYALVENLERNGELEPHLFGEEQRVLKGITGEIAWSASGRNCVRSSAESRGFGTSALLYVRALRSSGHPLSFSPDGKRLVDGMQLLDAEGRRIADLDPHIVEFDE